MSRSSSKRTGGLSRLRRLGAVPLRSWLASRNGPGMARRVLSALLFIAALFIVIYLAFWQAEKPEGTGPSSPDASVSVPGRPAR